MNFSGKQGQNGRGNAIQEGLDGLQALLGKEGFLTSASSLDGKRTADHAVVVKDLIKLRRLRNELFGSDFFADPAWDILLELYRSSLEQYRMSVSAVCEASNTSATTGLRHLNALESHGLVHRIDDKFDRRRSYVELTVASKKLMTDLVETYAGGLNRV